MPDIQNRILDYDGDGFVIILEDMAEANAHNIVAFLSISCGSFSSALELRKEDLRPIAIGFNALATILGE